MFLHTKQHCDVFPQELSFKIHWESFKYEQILSFCSFVYDLKPKINDNAYMLSAGIWWEKIIIFVQL